MLPEKSLEGRVAVITGGGTGIGRAVAHAAAYLVSDFADFITGDVLVVDGGQWLGKGMFGEGGIPMKD